MKASLFNKLCCPVDKKDLQLTVYLKNQEGDVLEGIMTCPHCQIYYPIIYGIPIMTPDEYREKALETPMMEKWGLSADPSSYKLLKE